MDNKKYMDKLQQVAKRLQEIEDDGVVMLSIVKEGTGFMVQSPDNADDVRKMMEGLMLAFAQANDVERLAAVLEGVSGACERIGVKFDNVTDDFGKEVMPS